MYGLPRNSLLSQLCQRELHGGPVHRRPFIDDFSCEGECSGTILCNASTARTAPVFGLQYGSTYNKFLAAADEDGFVSIINTSQELPSGLDDDLSPTRPVAQWTAHRNAIFDLQWAYNDRWMYTASGDTSLGLWDTSYAYKISSFYGHNGSVKTLSVSPHASEIVASGSCDGNLLVWDSRVYCKTPGDVAPRQSVPTLSPVLRLREPHARLDTSTPPGLSSSSRRSGALQGRIPPGVTAVNFLGGSTGHVIASGGVDGIVKFWDLRYTILPTTTVTVPGDVMASLSCSIQATNAESRMVQFNSTPAPQLGRRTHAITSLALRPDSSQLLVSHTGGHHLLYDVVRPDIGPVRWYGGHMVSSFYVKAAFSPDGTHIVSGSSDDSVCIWQVDDPEGDTPYRLAGHEREVTAVAWCPTDFCQLATAGDDYTVKVWNVHRQQQEEKSDAPGGWVHQPRANILLAARPKNVEETDVEMEKENVVPEQKGTTIDTGTGTGTSACEGVPSSATHAQAAAVPAMGATTPIAAATTAHMTATAGPSARGGPSGTIRIRTGNAFLREKMAQHSPVKMKKQATLAGFLQGTRSAQSSKEGSGGQPSAKRPRAAASDDDESMLRSPSERSMSKTASQSSNENHPLNLSSPKDS